MSELDLSVLSLVEAEDPVAILGREIALGPVHARFGHLEMKSDAFRRDVDFETGPVSADDSFHGRLSHDPDRSLGGPRISCSNTLTPERRRNLVEDGLKVVVSNRADGHYRMSLSGESS